MLVTFENKKHIINFTLDSLDEKLNPQHFFRINRHCIINHKAIVKVHNYFNYKLKVDLNPGYSCEIIVSKARVADFKEWLNN